MAELLNTIISGTTGKALTVSGTTFINGDFILRNGIIVSGISNDSGLTQGSEKSLVTEYAVKNYITNFSHNNLTGRTEINAHPSTSISLDTTNFTQLLNSSHTDVQLAFDAIDAHNHNNLYYLKTETDNKYLTYSGGTINGSVIIHGDLYVTGTTVTINTENMNVTDNLILINSGETGSGVTLDNAGILIKRGYYDDYALIFNETTDTFRIGLTGNTQAVSTREDNPSSSGISFWNSSLNRFDTNSNFLLNSNNLILSGTVTSNMIELYNYNNSTPTNGQLWYNGDILYFRSGDTSKNLLIDKLSELTDVIFTNKTEGDLIVYSGSSWVNIEPVDAFMFFYNTGETYNKTEVDNLLTGKTNLSTFNSFTGNTYNKTEVYNTGQTLTIFVTTGTTQNISGVKTFTANVSSTNTTTGTIIVTGGIGVSENVNIGKSLKVSEKFNLSNYTNSSPSLADIWYNEHLYFRTGTTNYNIVLKSSGTTYGNLPMFGSGGTILDSGISAVLETFDLIDFITLSGVTGDTNSYVSAKYKLESVVFQETSGNSAGNISIGTTTGGTDIVSGVTVGSNSFVDATILKKAFSTVSGQTIYISSSAWGTSKVNIYLRLEKFTE